MKRSNPNSGKKTHVPSDFKRLKAKVGKRAPQKANVTDTKFKTASVQVKSQTINTKVEADQDGESIQKEMVSSKGKHLSQLLAQLNHPSPNVRISCLQGMKDAIKTTPNEVIFNHLAAIVPSLSKSMVDDDSKVRKHARTIFQDVIMRVLINHAKEKMIPFLPLSLAYVASALNSLDVDVRFDGCTVLELICTNFGHELKKENEVHSLFTTIPAFVTLFDDVSGGAASVARRSIADIGPTGLSGGPKSSKKKQKLKNGVRSKTSEKSIGILKSFVSVLKVATLRGNDEVDVEKTWTINGETLKRLRPNGSTLLPSLNKSDLTFLPGGVATNALVWKSYSRRTIYKANRGQRIHHFTAMTERIGQEEGLRPSEKMLSLKTQIDLLGRLRNRIVELSQEGTCEATGLSISSNHLHDLSLLVAALRLLWNCHPRYFNGEDEAKLKSISSDGKTNEWKKFKTTARILLKLLMETFPVRDPSGNVSNFHNYNLLNASLCCAISEFGSVLDPPTPNDYNSKDQNEWVDDIFTYLLPKLIEDDSRTNNAATGLSKQNSRATLMKVVEQLLLRHESGVYFLESKEKHIQLISTIESVFFSSSKKPSETLCRSLEGRRAVYILLALISEHFQAWNVNDSEYWNNLCKMATVLPVYIMMWKESYHNESSLILSTLLAIIRCHDPNNATNASSNLSSFCNSIRESLTTMFVTKNNDERCSSHLSIFESFTSPETQKLCLSLVAVLKFPSELLLSSLTEICTRFHLMNEANLERTTIDYMMNVIYTTKNTIELNIYVKFLLQSVDFSDEHLQRFSERKNVNMKQSELICSFDTALAMSSRYMCLLLSDDESVTSLVIPELIKWFDNSTDNTKSTYHMVKARAATTYLAYWSLYLSQGDKCYFNLEENLRSSASKSITHSFFLSPDFLMQENIQIFLPVLTLLRVHPVLLCSVLRALEKYTKQEEHRKTIISNLSFLFQQKSLEQTFRCQDVSRVVMETIQKIEDSCSSGPLEIMTASLSVQIKTIIGFR